MGFTDDTIGGDPVVTPTIIERKRFNHILTVADRVSTSGTLKGGTYTFEDMDALDCYEVTAARGGWKVNATFESRLMTYTAVRAT
mgnify:CR=1 FL=1